MPYCTQADILTQIPADTLLQLTDDEDTGGIDTSVVDGAIAWADGKIDAYVGKRHSVPLDPVPPVVNATSVDLAAYWLYRRRGAVPEETGQAQKDAMQFLRDVATGTATLGIDDPDGTPAETHKPEITSDDRLFSREGLDGF